ncbi:hypothetical protein EVG20_g5122 [Dentipellis fragilis]|uniref:Uncharacterized protein n=1 Tax=Dentipellis fragilis TaxID=205917 RepID=A0A4Y9YUT2_9AGAM|nr:hypothetical protein EVG20_g5122 [Dentipellis fragilis]
MNGRPDMIRQQGIPHLSQNVLGMNQPFLPQQPSPAQPPQGQPPNMNLVQNSNNINPGMSFMQPGQPSNAAPNHHAAHLSQMHLQQANQQRRQQATAPAVSECPRYQPAAADSTHRAPSERHRSGCRFYWEHDAARPA